MWLVLEPSRRGVAPRRIVATHGLAPGVAVRIRAENRETLPKPRLLVLYEQPQVQRPDDLLTIRPVAGPARDRVRPTDIDTGAGGLRTTTSRSPFTPSVTRSGRTTRPR